MARSKQIVITSYGDESKLAIVESDIRDPSAHEVQLRVEYTIVSGSDVNMRRGTYPLQRKPPLTPGYSVIGTVKVNGAGCSKFQAGDRVACLSKYDGQSEIINLPEKYLVPVPGGVDGRAAVALILDWVTAYEMLHRAARVRADQIIFVHALSGAVGGALLRLAQLEGARFTVRLQRRSMTSCVNSEPFHSITRTRDGSLLYRKSEVSMQSSTRSDTKASMSPIRF